MTKMQRGLVRGEMCARTSCPNDRATYWNSSTLRWYCPPCAHRINETAVELCVERDEEPESGTSK